MAASQQDSATALDDIAYGRNHLRSVIARIDLVSPVPEVRDGLPRAVSVAARKHYPADEPRHVVQKQVQLLPSPGKVTEEAFVEWHFHGLNREKELVVVPQAVFVEWTRYECYESLRDEFVSVVAAFASAFPSARIGRIGLRYVNILELGEGEPLEWRAYLDPALLGILSYAAERKGVSRVLHHIEWVHDDLNLSFRFGAPNPDYPAPVQRRSFVLDYDAYRQGVLDASEVVGQLDRHHAAIQALFESNITEALREEMAQ